MIDEILSSLIDEFNDYIGLYDFSEDYYYYFLGRECLSVVYEKKYGHSYDYNNFNFLSNLSRFRLIEKSKSIGIYEYIINSENSTDLKAEKSRIYMFSFSPFSELNDGDELVYLVMHLKSEAKDIYNLLKEKEYVAKNVFRNICSYIFANENLYEIIDVLGEVMEKRDVYMPYHMTNVTEMSIKIGIEMGLNKKDLELLRVASQLHDVGKVFISENILNKKESLTNEEYDEIKKHCQYGYELTSVALSVLYEYKQVPEIISKHHENYDGSGYPYKLKGESIPLLSRIIRIADSIDAMATTRSYEGKLTLNEIIKELEKFRGIYYDPLIVTHTIKVLTDINKIKFNLEETINATYVNASIAIRDYDNKRINSYSGTFQIMQTEGRFKFRVISNILENEIRFTKQKGTVVFMNNGEIVEIECKICKFFKGELFLENLKRHPIDPLFSLHWDSECTIVKNKNQKYQFKLVELGGNGLVLESSDREIFNSNLFVLDEVLDIELNEMVDDLNLDLKAKVKVKNMYIFNQKIQIFCDYLNIKQQDADKILRLLFRKQSVSRLTKYKE